MAAAKVLARYYRNVLILDADQSGNKNASRKNVPQERHVHGLLKGGEQALGQLFPGITDRLSASGAVKASFSRDVRWYLGNRWLPRFESDISIYFQTRPLLENAIRDELADVSNIETRFGVKVSGYELNKDQNRICGVRTLAQDGAVQQWPADLVIDATGRGGLLPQWLKANEYGDVPEKRSVVALGYASCLFELPDDFTESWKSILIYPTGPVQTRGATLVQVEGNRWLLTLAGYHGDHPNADMADFMAFAKSLPQPDIHEAVKNANALGDIVLHKFPHGFIRQYARMTDFPIGILPLGDVNASLNPLFGQGMSSAFLQAQALDSILGSPEIASAFDFVAARNRYFKLLEDILKTPWDLALGEDFKFPATSGDRPSLLFVRNILKNMVIHSSSREIIEKFYSVVHLIEKQNAFYHPGTMIKIFKAGKPEE